MDPEPVDLVDWLCEAIVGKRLLVLLDNGEHLVGSLAELAGRLLAAVPGVRLLVTSQESLDIPGEVVRPVLPLGLPGPDQDDDPAAATRSSAVRLFVDGPRRRSRVSPSTPATPWPSASSFGGWTASRWRWNWWRPGCECWTRRGWSSVWTTGSPCRPGVGEAARRGSRRSRR
ncbi:hypothetical protein [Actinomadura sp. HBU206391]|uniref:hypothetical protein n=1 Tax=Actinomadura sp. HBU206391 TaxID=2731692 RepID=UPI00164FC6B2|nr:hypothetical protein [Actinomadura sp. HBU206391]MBC6458952.1 hypothetical protein [Actinomadura sp. HBU206391]